MEVRRQKVSYESLEINNAEPEINVTMLRDESFPFRRTSGGIRDYLTKIYDPLAHAEAAVRDKPQRPPKFKP